MRTFNRTGQNGGTQSLICDEPVNGRYVTVYGNDVIMCEFEAFGLPLSGMFSYHHSYPQMKAKYSKNSNKKKSHSLNFLRKRKNLFCEQWDYLKKEYVFTMSHELIPIKIATAKLKDLKLFLFELANGNYYNQSYNRNENGSFELQEIN